MSSNDARLAPPVLKRPKWKCPIPEKARIFESDPTEVVLQPLTVREEIEAARAARVSGNEGSALPIETLRLAVKSVNGKPVDWANNDQAWIDVCSSMVRELISRVYVDATQPKKELVDDFLSKVVLLQE